AFPCKKVRTRHRRWRRTRKAFSKASLSRNGDRAFLPIGWSEPGFRCPSGTSHNEIRIAACGKNNRAKEKFKPLKVNTRTRDSITSPGSDRSNRGAARSLHAADPYAQRGAHGVTRPTSLATTGENCRNHIVRL